MVMEQRLNDNKNYELLIRLDEKVTSLTFEFKDMKTNLEGRIISLENSRVKFNDLDALRSTTMAAIRELTDDSKSRAAQIELLTRYFWMAIGSLATLQTILIFFQDTIKSFFAR